MDTDDIRYFIEINKCKNFTTAAKNLHMNQSTLSRQIANLEMEMGAVLFLRNPRGVELTEAGREFLSVGSDILKRYEKLRADTLSLGAGHSGTLSVGMPFNIFSYFSEFNHLAKSKERDIGSFRYTIINVDELTPALLMSNIDLAINYEFAIKPFAENLTYKHFIDQSFALFVRKGHELAKWDRVVLDDLADCQIALLKYDSQFHPPLVRPVLSRINRSAKGEVRYYKNYESLYIGVSTSDEIGVMPRVMVDRMLEFYNLSVLEVEDLDTSAALVIAQRKNDPNPLINAFYQHCFRDGCQTASK